MDKKLLESIGLTEGETKVYFRARPKELSDINKLRADGLTVRQIIEATSCKCNKCTNSFTIVINNKGKEVYVPIGLIKKI